MKTCYTQLTDQLGVRLIWAEGEAYACLHQTIPEIQGLAKQYTIPPQSPGHS